MMRQAHVVLYNFTWWVCACEAGPCSGRLLGHFQQHRLTSLCTFLVNYLQVRMSVISGQTINGSSHRLVWLCMHVGMHVLNILWSKASVWCAHSGAESSRPKKRRKREHQETETPRAGHHDLKEEHRALFYMRGHGSHVRCMIQHTLTLYLVVSVCTHRGQNCAKVLIWQLPFPSGIFLTIWIT